MSLDEFFATTHFAGIGHLPTDEAGLPMTYDDDEDEESKVTASVNDQLLAKTSGSALRIGDRVSVDDTLGHWGEGEITERSTTDYGGSKLFPVFHIVSDDGQEIWMSAISLHQI